MTEILRKHTRSVNITPNINPYALGSVLTEFGNTKIHITVNQDTSIPPWLKGKGTGWVTAEYAMLPGSTHDRNQRERKSVSGRSQEIQRLIGRSLRTIVDLKALGERQLIIDCDVLVADGGTRTASITGAYVALVMAINKLIKKGDIKATNITNIINSQVAALSVGVNAEGKIIADLNYEEDSSCHTDMNLVMTSQGKFIEIQGTAEKNPFSPDELAKLIECGQTAMKQLFEIQNKVLEKCLNN
jgi:ribonuclease PH